MRVKESGILALAALAGFLGGSVTRMVHPVKSGTPEVIRARRFELVDGSKTVAFMGLDNDQETVLAFTADGTRQLAAFGLNSNQHAFVRLVGKDGTIRAVMQLEADDKPILGMSDESYEGRILLGALHGDTPDPTEDKWGLLFRSPGGPVHAAIGMIRDRPEGTTSGSISVRTRRGTTWSQR